MIQKAIADTPVTQLNTLKTSLSYPKLVIALQFAYRWIVIAPVLAFSTPFLAMPVLLFCFCGRPDLASRLFARFWARLNAAASLMKVSISGLENLAPGQSYVIVANHQSLVDIYVLYGFLGVDIRWVMKAELRRVPVLGLACDKMGHIYIDRSNTEAALGSINEARTRIKDGISVAFFPEGTRSRDGDLGQFKRGAFRFAIETGLPILPVTIHDTRKVLPSDTLDIVPGQVHMEIGAPIATTGLSEPDARALSRQAREVIATALARRR